ncbi:MAG: GAF domain-containing protein [Solirubrobacteraceae bacterium]|nr:GAF domain-containing protein [Solirubrobacteraceae bacterium]
MTDVGPGAPESPTPSGDGRPEASYAQVIAAFGDVTEALNDLHDLDDLLRLVARRICELVGVQRCSLYLREERSRLYRGQVGHWRTNIDEGVKRLTSGGPGDAFTREIVQTKAPVVVQNARTDPRPIRSTMRTWEVRSMMGVPMVLQGDVVGIVYLDDHDRPRRYSPADEAIASAFADLAAAAISQAKLTADLRDRLSTVAKQNAMMRRVAVVDDKLTELVLEGRNMREIAEAISQLTGKPCAIHGDDDRTLAVGRSPGDPDGLVPRLLQTGVREHPEVRSALDGLTDNRPAVVGPIPYAGVHNRFLVAPVATAEDHWGHLVLLEHQSRLTNFDLLVARRAATIIAWEMSAERRAAQSEWNVRGALAGELVRGNRDTAALERRAEHVGMRIDEPHVLCLVTTTRGSDTTLPDARTVAEALSPGHAGPAPLATGVTEGVAVILPVPDDEDGVTGLERLKARCDVALHDLAPRGRLLAGISTVCRGSDDYPGAFEQAVQVVRCLETYSTGDGHAVLSATDLGAGRLFLSTSNAEEATRFVGETLGGMLEDRSADELLRTLQEFFRADRSVRRSSQAMGVHENTIRYRLARVEDLTGLAVSTDSDDQFSVQLALLILRLQGRLGDLGATATEGRRQRSAGR